MPFSRTFKGIDFLDPDTYFLMSSSFKLMSAKPKWRVHCNSFALETHDPSDAVFRKYTRYITSTRALGICSMVPLVTIFSPSPSCFSGSYTDIFNPRCPILCLDCKPNVRHSENDTYVLWLE